MEDYTEYHVRIQEIKEAIEVIKEAVGAMQVPTEYPSVAKPFSELTFRLSNNTRDITQHLKMLEECIKPLDPANK